MEVGCSSSAATMVAARYKVPFLKVFAASKGGITLPLKAIRTVAIAFTYLVSFVPVWRVYLPGIWFSQVRPDLVLSASSLPVAAAAFNEVNDHIVRRSIARKKQSLGLLGKAFGVLRSERRVCELVNSRGQTLFTQSWIPGEPVKQMKGVVILLHGLNEHSGRYAYFASQLNDQGYGVYAMDWIGHGGSDGLHGFVDSLDQVVLDARLYIKQVKAEHPNVPVFLFGHSTGGAIALKTTFLNSPEDTLKGIILTSPAVRVKPSHPIVAALAPIFSFLLPRFQFRGATRNGLPISRDPKAIIAKYSDPLVYTGPIRIRTGTEILRLGNFLQNNLEKVTAPFLVLHGSEDQITDPKGSQDLYEKASSRRKTIQIYEGLFHDLLFELEKDDISRDIIRWLDSVLLQH